MIKKAICKIVFINFIYSQGAWMVSNRTHPELEWETIKTQNFNVRDLIFILYADRLRWRYLYAGILTCYR